MPLSSAKRSTPSTMTAVAVALRILGAGVCGTDVTLAAIPS
jgi:hypothetical protein